MANDYMAKLAADLEGMSMMREPELMPIIYRQEGGDFDAGSFGGVGLGGDVDDAAQAQGEVADFGGVGLGDDVDNSAQVAAAEAAAYGGVGFGGDVDIYSDDVLGGPDVEDDLTLEAFSLQARVQDQVDSYNKNGFPTPEEQLLYTEFKNQGMTNQEATVATAQSVSTPGGRQAMEDGFYGGYSYGGMLGTVQNAIQEYNDAFNARAQAFAKKKGEERDKQDAEIDDFTGIPDTEEKPGFFDNLIDSLNLDSLNPFSRDGERDQDLAQAYAEYGGSFTPITDFEKGVGAGIGTFMPGAGATQFLTNVTGSNVLGTITTPTGATLNLTESGNVYDAFMPDAPDAGNEPTITKKRKVATEKTDDDEEDKKEEVDKPYFPRNPLPFTPSEEQTLTNIFGPDSYLLNQTGLRALV